MFLHGESHLSDPGHSGRESLPFPSKDNASFLSSCNVGSLAAETLGGRARRARVGGASPRRGPTTYYSSPGHLSTFQSITRAGVLLRRADKLVFGGTSLHVQLSAGFPTNSCLRFLSSRFLVSPQCGQCLRSHVGSRQEAA